MRDVELNCFHILAHGPRDASVLIPLGMVTVQFCYPTSAIEPVSGTMALNGENSDYHFNQALAIAAGPAGSRPITATR